MPGNLVYVSADDDLVKAIQSADAGDTLLLEGGNYGNLQIYGIKVDPETPIQIVSADPDNPAVITELKATSCSGLSFDGITVDFTFQEGQGASQRAIVINDCQGIHIKNSVIDGDSAHGISTADDGFPTGFGLWLQHSKDIIIENTEIFEFYKGILADTCENVQMTRNDIHSLRSDGINFIECKGVNITENYIHDFRVSPTSDDHKDFIQSWTAGRSTASSDIVIRDNVLDAGDGGWTQSIFMRNEAAEGGNPPSELMYRNVLIDNNLIINSQTHGVVVGHADGLAITNNTMLRSEKAADPGETDPAMTTPRIWVREIASTDVVVTGNVTSEIIPRPGDIPVAWDFSNNVFLDPFATTGKNSYEANYYNARDVIESTPQALLVRPDSLVGLMDDTPNEVISLGNVTVLMALAEITLVDGTANHLVGDASLTLGSVQGTAYHWDFGDGHTADTVKVDHIYDTPGSYTVVMTATHPDGTANTVSQTIIVEDPELLSFDSATGQWSGRDLDNAPYSILLEKDGGKALGLGEAAGVTAISSDALRGIYGENGFDLALSVRAENANSAGELLHIYGVLLVNVTEQGALQVNFFDDHGEQTRVVVSNAKLLDGNWHDVLIQFDGAKDRLVVQVDNMTAVEGPVAGKVGIQGYHGLYLGNPWGQPSFDGYLRTLTVSDATRPMVASTYEEGVIRFDSFEGKWLGQELEDTLRIISAPVWVDESYAFAIGEEYGQVDLGPKALKGFFGTDTFTLTLSAQALLDASAGELLRIHEAVLINVTENGALQVNLFDSEGTQTRLVITGVDMFDGRWHDISLHLDGDTDLFSVNVDDLFYQETTVTGSICEMGYHGLYLGNPWGQDQFDGMIRDLALTAVPSEENTSQSNIPEYSVVFAGITTASWLIDAQEWSNDSLSLGATLSGDLSQVQAMISELFTVAHIDTIHIVDLSTPVSGTEEWLGRLPAFYNTQSLGFSVTVSALDTISDQAQRVIWNYEKYGVEISSDGIGLRVGVKDQGMKRFWVDDFEYDSSTDHMLSVFLDAEADVAQLWFDEQLVLNIHNEDISFVGAGDWEWGWDLGGGRGHTFEGAITAAQIWGYASGEDLLALS